MIGSHIALLWTAGGGRYAVPLAAVIEVVRPVWVTPVPEAPAHMLGLIGFRGDVVPVFDLRARFGAVRPDFLYRNRFIMVRADDRPIALVVDEVIDLVEFGETDVRGRDAFHAPTLPPIVSAVLTLEGRLVALLDVTSVVTVSDLEKVDSAIQALHASGDEARALPSLLDPVDDVLDPVEDDRANGGRP